MAARVRVTDQLELAVEGGGEIVRAFTSLTDDLEHVLMGSLDGCADASQAGLRVALTRLLAQLRDHVAWAHDRWQEQRIWIGLVRSEKDLDRLQVRGPDGLTSFDTLEVPPSSPAIRFEKDKMVVRVLLSQEERPDAKAVRRMLSPFLQRKSASCEVMVEKDEAPSDGFALVVDLKPAPRRGAVLGDLWELGDEAQALLRAAEGDELPRSAALDLLSAGRWDLFKGQPETDWLEAKGQPYDHLEQKLGDQNWRYELAKDVASFANAPEGGLIVLGMGTQDRGDGDVIQGHKEFDLGRVKASTYKKCVAQLVYPRVEGFEVRRVARKRKGWGLAVLVVPPQPEQSRPFLVQGAISDDRVLGAHVLLPTRRGDDTALMRSESIHTRLRLGEQMIRGERRETSSG